MNPCGLTSLLVSFQMEFQESLELGFPNFTEKHITGVPIRMQTLDSVSPEGA